MQQCVYGTKICDIYNLQKGFMQNLGWLWTEHYRGCDWPVERQSEIVCMLVADTLNTCCKIIVYLYYVVHQNILWNCQCNLVHLTAIL